MDDLQQKASTTTARCRDTSSWGEPAAYRFLELLWRHKGLLLAGSVVPALLAAGLLYALPRKHTATLAYERPLAESEYGILLRRFYSQENLDRIAAQLQEHGLVDFAQRLAEAWTERSIGKLIQLEPSPAYPTRLRTTDPETSERIGALEASLLFIRVTGKAPEEALDAAAVVRSNFEDVLPVYEVRKRLRESVQQFKTLAGKIEDGRFLVQLDLEKEQARLEKLRGVENVAPGEASGVLLEFSDVPNSREYLPLSYQVQAAESKIIDLQETLNTDAEKLDYYQQVLDLSNALLAKVEGSLLTGYTMPQYFDFLGEQLAACENPAMADYLKSYIRGTENLVLANTPAGEKPVVYPASRHLAATTALVFVVGLMISVFAAVLLGHRHEPRRASSDPPVEPKP